jgi:tetratricopeptide (TPR) repeat protein
LLIAEEQSDRRVVMMPDTASLWAAARRFEGVLRKDANALSFAPLAHIYCQLGLPEDALETARKGCRLHPDFAAGQLALAKSALECGFSSEALTAFEAVVRVTPENIEAQRLLADLYRAAGKDEAAFRCLYVADSLDMEPQEPFALAAIAAEAEAEALPEEELLDADILDLSDELVEDGSFDDPALQFAASPERPSLGAGATRAEPFLMESPPSFYQDEPPAAEPSPVMASATIAELYVSQGFPDRGAEVYRELLATDAGNKVYEKRLAELTIPMGQPSMVTRSDEAEVGMLEKLQEWLGNIGRVREWRTRNL